MPNIVIRIPEGVLTPDSRDRLMQGVVTAAADAENIPNHPKARFLIWAIVDEVAQGNWTCGGADPTAQFVPVLVQVNVPVGVLDDAARERYVAGIQTAVTDALATEQRQMLTSCILNEVQEGAWGVAGKIWRLPDFARHAGYRHLQPQERAGS